MDATESYRIVQRRARLDDAEQARIASEATLRTLAERIAESEANDVADQLPDELGDAVDEASAGDAERFGIAEFFERVAERERDRERVDPDDAELHAQAATDALSQAISKGQLDDVLAQLPSEYDALFETLDAGRGADLTGRGGPMLADTFAQNGRMVGSGKLSGDINEFVLGSPPEQASFLVE